MGYATWTEGKGCTEVVHTYCSKYNTYVRIVCTHKIYTSTYIDIQYIQKYTVRCSQLTEYAVAIILRGRMCVHVFVHVHVCTYVCVVSAQCSFRHQRIHMQFLCHS